MTVPNLSNEDRRAALDKAAVVRRQRAELRRRLKAGEVSLADVLRRRDDPVVGKMKVQALIESLPGYGKARAASAMDEIGIVASRRVQGLGSRQLAALVAYFDEKD
ncbi:MAG: integration host factor, actinobacterial type [Coriobacteriales bacterium]